MNDRRTTAAIFLILALAGLLMRLHLVTARPLIEYDPHIELCDDIRKHYASLVRPADSGPASVPGLEDLSYSRFVSMNTDMHNMRWHPPAYHILCAILGTLSRSDSTATLKFIAFTCNMAVLCLVFLLLNNFFPGERLLIFMGLNLVLFLPGNIIFSDLANNDVLLATLSALFLFLTMRRGMDSAGCLRIATLSLLCGLLLLVKYTGFVCFIYFNGLLLAAFGQNKITARRFFCCASVLWLACAAISGWFYWNNYSIYGNPVIFPGLSDARHHSFTSFEFIRLFSPGNVCWWESGSVLTGFYASFFSFYMTTDSWFCSRNEVLALNLPTLMVLLAGITSSLNNPGFRRLHLFFSISIVATVGLLWKYRPEEGILKCNYLMFLVPVLAVFFSEGLRWLRGWRKGLYIAAIALALVSDLAVIKDYLWWDGPAAPNQRMTAPGQYRSPGQPDQR